MSDAVVGPRPYHVSYSERCRDEAKQLLSRARDKNLFQYLAQAIEGIHSRLRWIPLDFGEPLRDYLELGIQVRVAALAPLVVTFGVDENRRAVYVVLPFKLLPNSGL